MNVSMTSMTSPMMGNRPPPPPPPDGERPGGASFSTEDILAEIDSDGSGTLSSDEVADSLLSKFITEDNWTEVGTDGDGTLSLSELEAHRESVGPPGGQGGPGAAPPTDADAMSVIESLLSQITSSDQATEATTTQAEKLYSAMQGLLTSLTV